MKLFKSKLHPQGGDQTQNSKVKSHMPLYQLSKPGAPETFQLEFNKFLSLFGTKAKCSNFLV